MQLVAVANIGPRLFADPRNRRLVEPSHFLQNRFRQHSPHLHGTRTPLFQRSIVEVRVRVRIQDFVRELRRHRRVDRQRANRATANPVEHPPQPVNIHGLGEHVLHHFLDQRMVGNLDIADDVFLARSHVGEDRRHKIVAANALNLWRNFLAALEAQQRQRAVGVPAPARGEDGRSQRRLLQHFLHRLGLQVVEDVAERKAVLLGQGDVQPVVGCCSLQLKVKRAAEALAQRQSPGFVDAAAEGRVDDELHPAAFVEEALGDDAVLRRHLGQHRAAGDDVLDELLGAGIVKPALVLQPCDRVLHFGAGFDSAQTRFGCSKEACRRLKPAREKRRHGRGAKAPLYPSVDLAFRLPEHRRRRSSGCHHEGLSPEGSAFPG